MLAGEVIVHHEEHVALQQPYVDVHYPDEKPQYLPVEERAVARVNNLCNVTGTVFFTLQKHKL